MNAMRLALVLAFTAFPLEARAQVGARLFVPEPVAAPALSIGLTLPDFSVPLELGPSALDALALPTEALAPQKIRDLPDAGAAALAHGDFLARLGARPAAPAVAAALPELSANRLSISPEKRFDAWGPAWRRRFFFAEDGAKIRYRWRPGAGDPIVFVHGRSIGGMSWRSWVDEGFHGRPVLVLERRGYGGSERGDAYGDKLGPRNAQDVATAIELARGLSGRERVGVVALSLGALMLPELPPSKVKWLALVSPGSPTMKEHLTPDKMRLALWTRAIFAMVRLMPRWWKQAWMRTYIAPVAHEGLRRQFSENQHHRSTHAHRLRRHLEPYASSPEYLEMYIDETLFGVFAEHRVPGERIPVFVGTARNEQTVPPAAQRDLVSILSATAESVRTRRWSGGHVTPLIRPRAAIRDIEAFERDLER